MFCILTMLLLVSKSRTYERSDEGFCANLLIPTIFHVGKSQKAIALLPGYVEDTLGDHKANSHKKIGRRQERQNEQQYAENNRNVPLLLKADKKT